MDNWQSTFLGLKQLPRELTAFEIEAFFTFTLAERQIIEDRRRPTLKLGLALQIGFLRMSGRLLDAVPMVPPALWRHLGTQFAIAAPDLASLRALYRRAPTFIAHQQLACEALGFRWLSEPQRRALVRALRRELTRTRDRDRLLVFARRWRALAPPREAIRCTRSVSSSDACCGPCSWPITSSIPYSGGRSYECSIAAKRPMP